MSHQIGPTGQPGPAGPVFQHNGLTSKHALRHTIVDPVTLRPVNITVNLYVTLFAITVDELLDCFVVPAPRNYRPLLVQLSDADKLCYSVWSLRETHNAIKTVNLCKPASMRPMEHHNPRFEITHKPFDLSESLCLSHRLSFWRISQSIRIYLQEHSISMIPRDCSICVARSRFHQSLSFDVYDGVVRVVQWLHADQKIGQLIHELAKISDNSNEGNHV